MIMFFEELFKTVRIAIILTFAFGIFYYVVVRKSNDPEVIYRIPEGRQEAATRMYNEVYAKTFNGANQTSASDYAREAVLKIYGEPIIVPKGQPEADPLEFIKPEKKPPSRIQK